MNGKGHYFGIDVEQSTWSRSSHLAKNDFEQKPDRDRNHKVVHPDCGIR